MSLSPRIDTIEQSVRSLAPNLLINGAMDFWQRGTSITSTTAAKVYTADRFYYFNNSDTPTPNSTVSRSTDVPAGGFSFSAKVQRNSGNTNTSGILFGQAIESSVILFYRNRTMTYSFWAKAGANYSPASALLNVRAEAGTGIDENPAATYTGQTALVNQNVTLTTTWQRFFFAFTVPSDASELKVLVRANHAGTAGADDSHYITGLMLTEGDRPPTYFYRNAPSIQAELAVCQRYFEKSYNINTAPGAAADPGRFSFAVTGTPANHRQGIVYKVTKRTTPTVSLYSSNGSSAGVIRDVTAGVDRSTTVTSGGENGFAVGVITGAVAGNEMAAQWAADAEL